MKQILISLLDYAIPAVIEFKTEKQKKEWNDPILKEKLKNITKVIAMVIYILFKKNIIVTEILRTQVENDFIYKWKKESGKKRPSSVHTYGRGIDIRVDESRGGLSHEEAVLVTKIANAFTYDPKRPKKKTALYGDAIHKDHLHIQTM